MFWEIENSRHGFQELEREVRKGFAHFRLDTVKAISPGSRRVCGLVLSRSNLYYFPGLATLKSIKPGTINDKSKQNKLIRFG